MIVIAVRFWIPVIGMLMIGNVRFERCVSGSKFAVLTFWSLPFCIGNFVLKKWPSFLCVSVEEVAHFQSPCALSNSRKSAKAFAALGFEPKGTLSCDYKKGWNIGLTLGCSESSVALETRVSKRMDEVLAIDFPDCKDSQTFRKQYRRHLSTL